MKAEKVAAIVGKTPHTSPERGRQIYDFIIRNKPPACLELGFAHGVATTWIAAALDEIGEGRIVAVDNLSALERTPSAKDILATAGLEERVELNFEPHSYTWHLMRNMERYVEHPFDFVFLDGAHTWDTDGFAFLLVEQMISIGSWVPFDDLDWTFDNSPSLKDTDFVRSLPEEMRSTPQVRLVWEKLVLPNPNFSEFREAGGWGWAKKVSATEHLDFSHVRAKMSAARSDRLITRIARRFRAMASR
jgi:predicted O-methyltransferase YrrM